MEWVFGGLLAGCLALLLKILFDFSHQALDWNAKVRQVEVEMEAAEAQVQVFVKGKEESLGRTKAIEAEMQSLENMKNELKNKIEEIKRQHSKKGKIILHRQGPQEG